MCFPFQASGNHWSCGTLVFSTCSFNCGYNPGFLISDFFLYYQIHTIAIIAEGIPEALTRKLIKTADEKGVTIIGPATVSVSNV